jgi:hypothetical protein
MNFTRRTFLQSTAVSAAATITLPRGLAGENSTTADKSRLAGEVGITTSSLSGHIASRRTKSKFTLLELPRIMRDELDMRVIDLNTATLASEEPAYLDKVRAAADKAGCILTNLKLNQRGLDMNSRDKDVRDKALAIYKKSIDAAARLGLKWARPLPLKPKPDMAIHVASYRELADYAAERNIQMLVENYGWMESDPESVPKLVKAIDRNVAVSPDTGNWKDNSVRYEGLAAAFPLAVSCDFKARKLGPNGEHELYDLKRCFEVGWKTGFRGPWCLEHANSNRDDLFRELALLRDMLRGWMKEANNS